MDNTILLWGPDDAPDSGAPSETFEGGPGRRVVRGVRRPSLTPFLPAQPSGTAAVVIPGGGYTSLMLDKEGTAVARWLSGIGVAAFVLRHRLPGEGHGAHAPLQDAQRAMRLLRRRAAEWNLDSARIGAVGLSSGAHLAASLGVAHGRRLARPIDDTDTLPARPAFLVLGYGPYSGNARDSLIDPDQAPLAPPEKQALYDAYPVDRMVTADAPPAFLVTAGDDVRVPPENSLRLYRALAAVGVPAELHVFAGGGHGFAIDEAQGRPVAAWTGLCEAWLAWLGLLPGAVSLAAGGAEG